LFAQIYFEHFKQKDESSIIIQNLLK